MVFKAPQTSLPGPLKDEDTCNVIKAGSFEILMKYHLCYEAARTPSRKGNSLSVTQHGFLSLLNRAKLALSGLRLGLLWPTGLEAQGRQKLMPMHRPPFIAQSSTLYSIDTQ